MVLAERFIAVLPDSFLGNLMIDGCSTLEWDSSCAVWKLPCGLQISDAVSSKPQGNLYALQEAHARHHDLGHGNGDWDLVSAVESGPCWEKVSVSCSCG